MSDDPKNPSDLSSLGIDLSQLFRPAWTQESEQASSKYASFEGEREDRPARGRHGGRDSSGPRENRDRGPRPERPARREGGSPGGGGAPRGERRGPGGRGQGERGRGPGRDRDLDRDRRPEPPAPKPALEGWSLDLVPEDAAIDGIARQIRSRAKAYTLFELARLIVKLSDRYSVRLKPLSPGTTPPLHRVKADGSLWQSRKEAAAHILAAHRDTFFRRATVSVEPPKGAFAVVAQCGMSGVVIGPPNHHEYTSKVIALHSARFRNLPFDVFKSRIRMVRDEALIEQWKTEQSTKTVYIPLVPGEHAEPAVEPAESHSSPAPSSDLPPEPETVETAPQAEGSPEAPAAEGTPSGEQAPAAESAAPSGETAAESAADAPAEAPADTEEAPASSGEPSGLSEAEILPHFLQHHADGQIEETSGECVVQGKVALHGSSPLLRELLLSRLQELDRFPLPLAQTLGRELSNLGLQIFKSHRKIIHVSLARPRFLDRENTPISDSFRSILEYLEAHPNQRRDKQWAALIRLRTETVETPSAPATPLPPAVEPGIPTVAATLPGTVAEAGIPADASLVAQAPDVEATPEAVPPVETSPSETVPAETAIAENTPESLQHPGQGGSEDLRAGVHPEPSPEAAVSTASPTEAPVTKGSRRPEEPDEATLRKREQALGADLLWLLHQGHVIDFAMGNLQAATKPAPRPAPKPKKAPAGPKGGHGLPSDESEETIDLAEAESEEASTDLGGLIVDEEDGIVTLSPLPVHGEETPGPDTTPAGPGA